MIGNSWDELLKQEYQKEYFKNLMDFIKQKLYTLNKVMFLMPFVIQILTM